MDMDSFSSIKPTFSIQIRTSIGDYYKPVNTINRTLPPAVINRTHSAVRTSSVVINNKKDNPSNDSSSGDVDMLFTWVFIACVGLALLLIISLFLVLLCWRFKRRRRTVSVTNDRSKDDDKDRKKNKAGRTNLRQSLKRVFVSDGPLYAVSQLNINRYSGIPGNKQSSNPASNRSSMEVIISPGDVHNQISKNNQHIVYQRYLSPIEGVPHSPRSVSPARDSQEGETYLQPIDELRASKRFLQTSKDEHVYEDSYLQPLHGIPVPDEQKTSTPKVKPIPSPKPNVKPKP